MTIILVAVCTVLTILCINLYFKLAALKKDLYEYKDTVSGILNKQFSYNTQVDTLWKKVRRIDDYITEP